MPLYIKVGFISSASSHTETVTNNRSPHSLGTQIATGRKVAIKKIKIGQFKDGLDLTAIREVKFLQEFKHTNIVELVDVFSHKTNLNLVLEYLDSDLEQIIKDKSILFMPADIKSWMMMMLRGLDHCHQSWVLHRVRGNVK